MQKKYFLFVVLWLSSFTVLFAVNKSDDLNKTIETLRIELDALQRNTPIDIVKYKSERGGYLKKLQTIFEKTDELLIVMYSQRNHSIFSMTYTCKQVQDLCNEFFAHRHPFATWTQTMDKEMERYDKLKSTIISIDSNSLPLNIRQNQQTAILTCDSIYKMFVEIDSILQEDSKQIEVLAEKIEGLETYTLQQYEWLKKRIFLDGGISYISMLEDINMHYALFVSGVDQTYSFYRESKEISFLYMFLRICTLSIFLILGAFIISYALVFWLFKKSAKRLYYVLIGTLFLFIISLFYCNVNVFTKEYLSHAAILIIEYTLSLFMIILSVTLRISDKKIKSAFWLYLPFLILGLFPILFRILIIQNAVVDFLWPIILVLATMVYLPILIKHAARASRTDAFYGWFSFFITLSCTVLAWIGYRFMSLQIVMLWLTLVTTIQILISVRHFLMISNNRYISKHQIEGESQLPWYSNFMNGLIMPLLTVIAIYVSFLWAAHVFDLSDFMNAMIQNNFLEIPKVVSLSIGNILWLICIAIVVNYGIFAAKEILRSIFGDRYESGTIPVFVRIGIILVWAIYVAGAMILLNVDYSGVAVVMGGFGMGIGFAMKETIDNFICGMSLMTGRVRLGDTIECDGIRGSVTSIGYRSTLIETVDGSVLAFLNTQLFAKNFKNITRNHGYELGKINVGIAYGTNIERARQLILDVTRDVDVLQKGKTAAVFVDQFGSSSVDLVVIVWVPVKGKGAALSAVKEGIYRSFNENGIVIPFPQQDIYIREFQSNNQIIEDSKL